MAKHKLVVPALLAVAIALAGAATRAEIIEQILVKVNGDIFTKTDLEQRQVQMLRQKGQQFDLKGDQGSEQLSRALDEITPQIMVDAVDEMVIVQRGRELGYKLSDDQFKKVIEDIRRENKIETEEQFQEALKSENMTIADLRRNLEKQMIIQRVQQNEILGKIGVTEDEAKKYYESHMKDFTTTPSVTLREIQVAVATDARGVNVGAEESASARIAELRTRATQGGEGFDTLATEFSEAPSKANGGLIGPISLNDVAPQLRELLAVMKVGDVSQIIRIPRGFQLLKLEDLTAAQTMPFEQARDQISERVFTDKRKAEFQKYIEKQRAQAIIEWKNQDVKKAFDLGLKQQAARVDQ